MLGVKIWAYHLQGTSDYSTKQVGIVQVFHVGGQLDVVDQGVGFQNQGEGLFFLFEVLNLALHTQEHWQGHLKYETISPFLPQRWPKQFP